MKKETMYADGRMSTIGAAHYLGVSPKTLSKMRTVGNGPIFVKRGGVFYFKADLDSWLAAGRVSSTAELKAARANIATVGV
jgi:hypothetical protein